MQVNLQRCNVCKKVNVDESEDWVRLSGGATNKVTGPQRNIPLDFCPECAAKTNVKDAPALMPPAPQPMGPRLRPNVVAEVAKAADASPPPIS